MRRIDLEHVLRAASAITNERDFIVFGSQSILGQLDGSAPEGELRSLRRLHGR